jgi:cytidylate kinase
VTTTSSAGLVVARGGLGTGKTKMCINVTQGLRAKGIDAEYVSVGWWFRAILAVARELSRIEAGDLPDTHLYRHAARYTGSQLVDAAQGMGLTIHDGDALVGAGVLRPVSGEVLNQMAGVWGGDHEVRRWTIQDISLRITGAPHRFFVVDSRSGNSDYGHLRKAVLNVYLTVDDEVGAKRKLCTVEALRSRNWADRNLPEGPLLDPSPDDHVLDTTHMSEEDVASWLLGLLEKQFLLRP